MANKSVKDKTRGQKVLEQVLTDTGLTATAFAKYIGISLDTIQNISGGRVQRLSNRVIDAICVKYPRYNKFWLLSAEGEKYVPGDVQVVNTVNNGNIAAGAGAQAGTGSDSNAEIIKRLLDELAAQRQQNQELIELLKRKM